MNEDEKKEIAKYVADLYHEHFDDNLKAILERLENTSTKQDIRDVRADIHQLRENRDDTRAVVQEHSKKLRKHDEAIENLQARIA